MSLDGLKVAVEDNRAVLEAGGIRGIDLDYLLDPRVDHASCLDAFNKMIAGECFGRWAFVLSESSVEQVEYLKVVEPKHPKVVAAHEARRALKNWFKGYVLCFYKDMMRKHNEARRKFDAAGVPLKGQAEDEQQ